MTRQEKTEEIIKPTIAQIANKTTNFILPAIDLNSQKTSFKLLRYFGFVNCFIEHKQSIYKGDELLYIVFNPSNETITNFNKFYDNYKNYPTFVTDYMIDYNLVVLVFKVKEKWKKTYLAFKNSKYSEMSKEYADMFKSVGLDGKIEYGYQFLIIHRNKDYRETLEEDLAVKIDSSAELMSPINLQKEQFDYEPTT